MKELYFDSFRLSGNEHADICMKHMQLYGVIHYPTLFSGLAVNVATFSQSGKVHCLVYKLASSVAALLESKYPVTSNQ